MIRYKLADRVSTVRRSSPSCDALFRNKQGTEDQSKTRVRQLGGRVLITLRPVELGRIVFGGMQVQRDYGYSQLCPICMTAIAYMCLVLDRTMKNPPTWRLDHTRIYSNTADRISSLVSEAV